MRRADVIAIAAALLAAACDAPPDTVVRPNVAPPDAGPADAPAPDAPPPPPPDAAIPDVDAGPPDAAPPPDAIPPPDASPDASPDQYNPHGIHFTEVTTQALVTFLLGGKSSNDVWGTGQGAAIGDVDGDGDLDVIIARIHDTSSLWVGGPIELLRNDGQLGLIEDPGLNVPNRRGHGAALGDFDRDGDLDAFIAAEGYDLLLENDGTGVFVDVAAAAGVAGAADDVSVGGVFADVNHDGLLDLYVVNHAAQSPPFPSPAASDRLYLNLGDGTFLDVSAESGANTDGSSQAALVFDLEATGDPVIYVANDRFYVDGAPAFGTPELLPGDAWYALTAISDEGVPQFLDRTLEVGVFAGRSSMGVAIADVDRDLTPDVYVTDWGTNDLYLNTAPGHAMPSGTFAHNVGVRRDWDLHNLISWGARFRDLDRDGLLELFVVNGGINEALVCTAWHQYDVMLRQHTAGLPFEEITASAGFPSMPVCFSGEPAVGRGGVWGDLDGDGDDDLIVTPHVERYRVYRNDTPSVHHELRVRLQGTVSAVDPIGATLLVTRNDGSQAATYRYAGGDTLSQSDALLRVGLGDDTSVLAAEVRWPSGLITRIDGQPGFALDAELAIVEPAWLAVEPRVVTPADPAPMLVYTPVDDTGAPLGIAGAGRLVEVVRSDTTPVVVTDHGDGTYSAPLPHPGVVRRTVLTITVDGTTLRPRPMISYR